MPRSDRLFEVIQLLRRARRPLTARRLADELEVTERTIYRDIAALQAMRVPIRGEAGVGYVMRPGYDLPPLTFDHNEVEAIVVGLALLHRTGDKGLVRAARGVSRKLADALPAAASILEKSPLRVSTYGTPPPEEVDVQFLRDAMREFQKLSLHYSDAKGRVTRRIILPLAIVYYTEVTLVAAWCEKRQDFRHFRVDRMKSCVRAGESFAPEAPSLRRELDRLGGPESLLD